jgi:hypothetical protein
MSDCADRALIYYADIMGIQEKKLSVMMDLEFVDEVIPLDFDRLLASSASDFGHDMAGIYQNWNRQAKEMENCFVPRCAKPEAYTGEGNENDGTIVNRVLAPPASPAYDQDADVPSVDDQEPGADPLRSETDDGIVTVIDENVDDGYAVVVEYNGHVERYDFGADVERLGAVEFSIEAFRKNAPPDVLPVPVAKPIGPTAGEQFDKSRAVNLYLMAARDLGTALRGFSLDDLLADKTDWALDKCKRLALYVVEDSGALDLLRTEGVPAEIPPRVKGPQRKRYAGTQFESDDDQA